MKRRSSDFWPAVIGGALGVALSGYAFGYVPMKRNFDQCGQLTLCPAQGTGGFAQDRNGLDPQGAGPVAESDAPTPSTEVHHHE